MHPRYRFPALLSIPLALLLAIAAAGALVMPAVYAREAALWAAQGVGQDWVDLVLVAPALLAWAIFTLRGSRIAVLLLAGGLAYACYSLVLYAFFLHFGPLFLVYTWGLGLAFYALVSLAFALHAEDVRAWFGADAPVRVAGGLAVAVGLMFTALWLSETVPAVAAGKTPHSVIAAGLITNPVHVLDLGLVLPAFIVGGAALFRRRALGYWLTPVMLAFGVIMDLALIGMVVSMSARGLEAGGPRLAIFVIMIAVTAGVLAWLLRHVGLEPYD